jgi:hypothetical protein
MKPSAAVLFGLALGLAACDDRPKQWDAFVYPDFEGSYDYERIAGFKSLELCRQAATNRIAQLPHPDQAQYECGYMCRHEPGMDAYICKETKE